MRLVRRTVLATASLALAATLTACTGGEESSSQGADKSGQKASQGTESRSALQVMTAATRKTSEAKSAKISMTMTMPGDAGGTVEMNGVMGWDPYVMDVTMTGSQFAATPDAPEEIRMIWLDKAMYMDMGEKASTEMDGKRWMKLDLQALSVAEHSGDGAATAEGLQAQTLGMGQNPAQQMGVLLDSPSMEFVGKEKLDGVSTRHYEGSLSVHEIMAGNKALDVLGYEQRKQFVKQLKAAGVNGYDVEVWLNGEDMPVRIDVAMGSGSGTITVSQRLSDFGTATEVQAPPAGETFDLFKMLEEMKKGSAGATAGAGAA